MCSIHILLVKTGHMTTSNLQRGKKCNITICLEGREAEILVIIINDYHTPFNFCKRLSDCVSRRPEALKVLVFALVTFYSLSSPGNLYILFV